jgi:hypothetical protein
MVTSDKPGQIGEVLPTETIDRLLRQVPKNSITVFYLNILPGSSMWDIEFSFQASSHISPLHDDNEQKYHFYKAFNGFLKWSFNIHLP